MSKLALDTLTAASVVAVTAWVAYAAFSSAWIPVAWQLGASSFFVTASWQRRTESRSLLPLQLAAAGGLASFALAGLQALVWPSMLTVVALLGLPAAGLLAWVLVLPAQAACRPRLLAYAFTCVVAASAVLAFTAGWLIWLQHL